MMRRRRNVAKRGWGLDKAYAGLARQGEALEAEVARLSQARAIEEAGQQAEADFWGEIAAAERLDAERGRRELFPRRPASNWYARRFDPISRLLLGKNGRQPHTWAQP